MPEIIPTPTEPSLPDRALALLVMLGSDADEVADTLFEKGCFGAPVDCGACPVAVYLLRELDLHSVSVSGDEVTLHYGPDPDAAAYADVPPAVDAFVGRFDGGRYPRLIAGRVTA
jgi:hypothetical protein